jgi:succinate-acetate transporter protein
MAVGNTFGATALSSYGGFWIAYGILLTPNWNILGDDGPYAVAGKAAGDPTMANSAVGFFLTGWFIFTTILLLCTLRSTIMFFMLFFTLDLAFLMLACGEYAANNGAAHSSATLTKAGGGFGMLAAFLAWYNAFAGIADTRYVTMPPSPSPSPVHRVTSHKHNLFLLPSAGHICWISLRDDVCHTNGGKMGRAGAQASGSSPQLWTPHYAEMPSASSWSSSQTPKIRADPLAKLFSSRATLMPACGLMEQSADVDSFSPIATRSSSSLSSTSRGLRRAARTVLPPRPTRTPTRQINAERRIMTVAAVGPRFCCSVLLLLMDWSSPIVNLDGYGTLDYLTMKQAVGVLPSKIYF